MTRTAASDGDYKGKSVRIGTGVLFGLNESTPDTTLKLGVEIEFRLLLLCWRVA